MSSSTSVQSISDEITVIENPKLPVVEYRVNKKTSSNVCKLFLLEFKDDVQTEWRKCIKCDALVKAPNSGTSGLSKHADSCAKSNKRKAPTNQPKIGFKKCPKLNLPKGMDTVSKLVYKDNIPITAVAKSEANAQNDHGYNLGTEITLADFERRICADDFRVEAYMITFKPASVDPERLFSLCRYSKNYLQCRMTAAHHARNVFLKKNEKFL